VNVWIHENDRLASPLVGITPPAKIKFFLTTDALASGFKDWVEDSRVPKAV
jgi:hypothetical protein